jgi:peptidoglycan/LPS O-acetylase OafA/YrhL
VGTVILTLCSPALIHHWIERPGIAWGKTVFDPSRRRSWTGRASADIAA